MGKYQEKLFAALVVANILFAVTVSYVLGHYLMKWW